jgi:hypothetical protein
MRVRGFQTFVTYTPQIIAYTFTPFCIGFGTRIDSKVKVGIIDIVILGFGLSFEYIKKGDNNDRGHTGITRFDSSREAKQSAATASSSSPAN